MFVGERKVQLGHGKQLAGAIVQIAAESAALFISQIQEMTGDNAQLLFGAPEFGDVGIQMQASERLLPALFLQTVHRLATVI